jgi:hypothetical protein
MRGARMAMAYEDLIAACEARGAKMYFEKEGHQWGGLGN